MNELQKLKADLAAIAERIASLEVQQDKEPEIDWSQMAGRIVEVRNNTADRWRRLIFERLNNQSRAPYLAGGLHWQQCRPYTGPLRPNFIPHDGRDECPVDPESWVLIRRCNGTVAAGKAVSWVWSLITAYQVIEP